jgi:hypothetical protein
MPATRAPWHLDARAPRAGAGARVRRAGLRGGCWACPSPDGGACATAHPSPRPRLFGLTKAAQKLSVGFQQWWVHPGGPWGPAAAACDADGARPPVPPARPAQLASKAATRPPLPVWRARCPLDVGPRPSAHIPSHTLFHHIPYSITPRLITPHRTTPHHTTRMHAAPHHAAPADPAPRAGPPQGDEQRLQERHAPALCQRRPVAAARAH